MAVPRIHGHALLLTWRHRYITLRAQISRADVAADGFGVEQCAQRGYCAVFRTSGGRVILRVKESGLRGEQCGCGLVRVFEA